MNIKKNKKIVLWVTASYLVYFVFLFVLDVLCHSSWCRVYDDSVWGLILLGFAPLLPVLLLSLITYRLRDEVFTAWWSFAKWWVPMIIGVTLFLNSLGGGGTLGMNNDFTAFILIILYSIFIITSLVKIVRAYLRTK